MKKILRIDELDVKFKTVFLRIDGNVPLTEDLKVADDSRLKSCLKTIEYLLEQETKIIVSSHLGRPNPKDKSTFPKNSLMPVANWLQSHLNKNVYFVDVPYEESLKALLPVLKPGKDLIVLENLRFLEEETTNNAAFAQKLSNFIDVYINDAFGVLHRKHMSVHALPAVTPKKGMGFLVEQEVMALNYFMKEAPSPKWALLGGLKVSDKIRLIDKLMDEVDGLIIGGAMAYTFLKALKKPVGSSFVEENKVSYALNLLERAKLRGKQIILPIDHKVSKNLNVEEVRTVQTISSNYMGVDIGPQTLELIETTLKNAQSILWNGPFGLFEKPLASEGSTCLTHILAGHKKAYTLVGGGDSVRCVNEAGCADEMNHISTGGGASLKFLEGDRMVGLEQLFSLTSEKEELL